MDAYRLPMVYGSNQNINCCTTERPVIPMERWCVKQQPRPIRRAVSFTFLFHLFGLLVSSSSVCIACHLLLSFSLVQAFGFIWARVHSLCTHADSDTHMRERIQVPCLLKTSGRKWKNGKATLTIPLFFFSVVGWFVWGKNLWLFCSSFFLMEKSPNSNWFFVLFVFFFVQDIALIELLS